MPASNADQLLAMINQASFLISSPASTSSLLEQ